ncbi:MAG TPA: hypothetical protein VGE52_15735 [Pirellulales bacterium]
MRTSIPLSLRSAAGWQRVALFVLLALLGVHPNPAAGEDAPAYRWVRDVTLPMLSETSLLAAPLDSHFYQATRDGWPDVRLRTEDGGAAAFLIRATTETTQRTVRKTWTSQQTNARLDPDGTLHLELALRDDESPPLGLRIITPVRDFERQVHVETSLDGQTWTAAGGPVIVFDYSRIVDVRNDVAPFPAGAARKYRVSIAGVTVEQESQLIELHRRLRNDVEEFRDERSRIERQPFRIDAIEFYRDESLAQPGERRLQDFEVSPVVASRDETNLRSFFEFDGRREPITQLRFEVNGENFSRAVIVEGRDGQPGAASDSAEPWRTLTHGTLTRFAVGSLRREQLTLPIPESRCTKYRLTVEDGDSPALPISGAAPRGPAYELLCLGSPGKPLQLEYGSPSTSAGRYDSAALEAALAAGLVPLSAGLGPPQPNGLAAPPAVEPPWRWWNDVRALTAAIVVLAAFLGVSLFVAARQVADPPR